MSAGLAALHDLPGRGRSFVMQSLAVAHADALKLRHDPTEIITRAVQPVLWLTIFGELMTRIHGIPTGSLTYLEFLTPGILAQSSLFVAIFYGFDVLWERDLGILVKYIASPASRGALVLGKGLAAGVRGISQAAIIFAISPALGVRLNFTPLSITVVIGAILLGAAIFCTFSLIIACTVKARERFMGIGQILTMPLFFASNAIYPIDLMPPWMSTIAKLNPLTYQVDALRSALLGAGQDGIGLGIDFAVMSGTLVVMLAIAAKIYPTVLY